MLGMCSFTLSDYELDHEMGAILSTLPSGLGKVHIGAWVCSTDPDELDSQMNTVMPVLSAKASATRLPILADHPAFSSTTISVLPQKFLLDYAQYYVNTYIYDSSVYPSDYVTSDHIDLAVFAGNRLEIHSHIMVLYTAVTGISDLPADFSCVLQDLQHISFIEPGTSQFIECPLLIAPQSVLSTARQVVNLCLSGIGASPVSGSIPLTQQELSIAWVLCSSLSKQLTDAFQWWRLITTDVHLTMLDLHDCTAIYCPTTSFTTDCQEPTLLDIITSDTCCSGMHHTVESHLDALQLLHSHKWFQATTVACLPAQTLLNHVTEYMHWFNNHTLTTETHHTADTISAAVFYGNALHYAMHCKTIHQSHQPCRLYHASIPQDLHSQSGWQSGFIRLIQSFVQRLLDS